MKSCIDHFTNMITGCQYKCIATFDFPFKLKADFRELNIYAMLHSVSELHYLDKNRHYQSKIYYQKCVVNSYKNYSSIKSLIRNLIAGNSTRFLNLRILGNNNITYF